MNRLREIMSRTRRAFGKRRRDARLEEELRTHLALLIEQNIARGMTPEEARRTAKISLGGEDQIKESVGDHRGLPLLDSLAQDIRFAFRMLRKSPGFTAVAILTLALGIGANTAIFSATYSILLRPLPYKNSERLVDIGAIPLGEPVGAGPGDELNTFPIEKIQALTQSFDRVTSFEMGGYTRTTHGEGEFVLAGLVSGNYFTTLGVRPALGRMILPPDARQGSAHVVVLSYKFWQKDFSGDVKIVGRQIELADAIRSVGGGAPLPYTIIGVAPVSFSSPVFASYGQDCDLWTPNLTPLKSEGFMGGDMTAIALLKPGVTLPKANAALRSLSEVLGDEYPQSVKGWTLHAEGLKDTIIGIGKPQLELLILWGAVGFLLLIACANVSSLALARGWGRTHEIAIRESLGATRLRVVRQLLTETLLLFLFGCGIGLLLALWGVSLLRAFAPAHTPRAGEIAVYPAVLWYALGISIVTGIAFGLAPALQVSGRKLGARLNASGLSSIHAGGQRNHVYRHGLILVEVSLAVVLLIGSGLLLRSFAKLLTVPLGFRTDHILTMYIGLAQGACKQGPLCDLAFDQMLGRIRALPGVEDVALTNYLPLHPGGIFETVSFEPPSAATSGQQGPTAKAMQVSPAYFRLTGIPLLRGREFTEGDSQSGSPLVVIVNQAFADKFLSGHAIGKRLWYGVDKKKRNRWVYIVGEVEDTRDSSPLQAPQPEIYHPFGLGNSSPNGGLLVRAAGNPEILIPAIRQQVSKVSTGAILNQLQTMNQLKAKTISQPRFRTALLGAFAALGLILTIVGIYGVISYSVVQRTHEIGVRMALGAGRGDVLRMILREGLLLATVGIAIGVAGALALTRLLRSLLFDINPSDPATFIGVAILLALVALLACYVPARRAMKVDPMVALRYE